MHDKKPESESESKDAPVGVGQNIWALCCASESWKTTPSLSLSRSRAGYNSLFYYLSYSGSDCSIIPTCHNVSECSSNGLCVDYDVCKCDKGWTGDNCTQFSCEHLDYCSGNAFASLHYEWKFQAGASI